MATYSRVSPTGWTQGDDASAASRVTPTGWEQVAGAAGATHSTSGTLTADAATVAGTATHLTLHATTGTLEAQPATVSGAALHPHTTSGALTAGSAEVAGSAAYTAGGTFTTDGALAAQDAAIAGSATHLTLHATTGVLEAQAATLSGVALHPHTTSGTLTADAAAVSGEVAHTAPGVHDTTGDLVAQEAQISGDAAAPQRGGGGYDKPKKKRWLVKVGEQTLEVGSLQQATKVLDRFKAQVAETKQAEAPQAVPQKAQIVERPEPAEVKAAPQIEAKLTEQINTYNQQVEAVVRYIQEQEDEESLLMLL